MKSMLLILIIINLIISINIYYLGFNFTFIRPYPMTEALVILYINLYAEKSSRYICYYTKNQLSYKIIFKEIRDILTNDNTFPITLQIYDIDYETALENV